MYNIYVELFSSSPKGFYQLHPSHCNVWECPFPYTCRGFKKSGSLTFSLLKTNKLNLGSLPLSCSFYSLSSIRRSSVLLPSHPRSLTKLSTKPAFPRKHCDFSFYLIPTSKFKTQYPASACPGQQIDLIYSLLTM